MHTSTWTPLGQNRYISTLTYEPLHHCDHNMNNLLVVLRGITLHIHIGFAIQFMLKETSHPFRIFHNFGWTGKQFVGDSWRPSCTLQAALSVKFISHWNLQLCSTISLKFVWTCHKGHNHYAMSHSLYNIFPPFFQPLRFIPVDIQDIVQMQKNWLESVPSGSSKYENKLASLVLLVSITKRCCGNNQAV